MMSRGFIKLKFDLYIQRNFSTLMVRSPLSFTNEGKTLSTKKFLILTTQTWDFTRDERNLTIELRKVFLQTKFSTYYFVFSFILLNVMYYS